MEPLTEQERETICRLAIDIEGELVPRDGDLDLKTALIAEMFMALAGGAMDALTVRSKQGVYAVALVDIPAWAVREALNQWYQGSVKTLKINSEEYRWPPAPGVLAIICRGLLQPYKDAVENLNTILTVKPLDETLKLLHQRGAA